MKGYPDNGRFDVSGDAQSVVGARFMLWKLTRLWYKTIEPGLSLKDDYWLAGIDRRTDAPVQIHPRGRLYTWAQDLATETVARRVQALALPHTVPVLHVGPGIVFAAPPLMQPRPTLSIEVAAACALQACEVAARLHAHGIGRLSFGPSHLRLLDEGGELQIRWLVPGVPYLDLLEALEVARDPSLENDHARWQEQLDPIQHDLWQLAFFFFSLLATDTEREASLDSSRNELLQALSRIRDEGPIAGGINDAAFMARLFATLAGQPARRTEDLPVVRVLPRIYPDWDDVIVDGEASLKSEPNEHGYIGLPLAVAYHQRASRAWARGDINAALADVDRALALDDYAPYHTTRAVLLNALDRRTEASAAIAAAFEADARPKNSWAQFYEDENDDKAMKARAHLTRGIIALRDGALEQAEADLRRSDELNATASSARALAAVARARENHRR